MQISRRDLLLGAAAFFPLRAQDFKGDVKVVSVFANVHNSKNDSLDRSCKSRLYFKPRGFTAVFTQSQPCEKFV